jgi:hypothetical protein
MKKKTGQSLRLWPVFSQWSCVALGLVRFTRRDRQLDARRQRSEDSSVDGEAHHGGGSDCRARDYQWLEWIHGRPEAELN